MGVPNTGSGVSVGVGGGVFVGSSFCGSGVVVSTNGYGVLVGVGTSVGGSVGTIVSVGTGIGVSVGIGIGVSVGAGIGVSVGSGVGVGSHEGPLPSAWAVLIQSKAVKMAIDKMMVVRSFMLYLLNCIS